MSQPQAEAAAAAAPAGGKDAPAEEKPAQQQQQLQAGQSGDDKAPAKSKAELRRERARLQEEQRAAKALKKEQAERDRAAGKTPEPKEKKDDKKKKEKEKEKDAKPAAAKDKDTSSVGGKKKKKKAKDELGSIHPDFAVLGEQYLTRALVGGNARCVAMLGALISLVKDEGKEKDVAAFQEDFKTRLKRHIGFLASKRKLSYSMGNAVNYIKARTSSLVTEESVSTVEEAREFLLREIEDYREGILAAEKRIAETCLGITAEKETPSQPQLVDGDVVLTFTRSSAVDHSFRLAQRRGVRFEVICVDSRPLHEGRAFSLKLSSIGIPVTYCLVSSLSSVLPRCTKVFVGSSTMLTNGSLVSRAGTAMVCMMAKHFSLPVLAFCETYKFADSVWLGSLTNNEQAPAEELATLMDGTHSPLCEEESVRTGGASVASWMYDVTPAEYIDMVITELGPVHPFSVPVVVRERAQNLD